jgi:phage terminase large subunit GpA-like protein
VLKVGGLTGGDVRGMKHVTVDGTVLRPELALIDDPQTDKTARSRTQNEQREKLLSGAVLGMAGPGRKIAAMLTCTVIMPGDMADRVLNRDIHPEWQGVRKKLLYSFPTKEAMVYWEEYARMRADGLKRGDEGRAATEYYRTRQHAMDAGAVVAWKDRYNHDEISAVQNAMNLFYRDKVAFYSECQNEPAEVFEKSEWADAETIAKRVTALHRGQVPVACNTITSYMDVHKGLIYWAVAAWQDDSTGYIIDYGTHPQQARRYFTHAAATKTLSRAHQGKGEDGAIYAGLAAVCDDLLPKAWRRDDGADLRINLAMIDANWKTKLVHQFIRDRGLAILFPAKGVGLTASSNPWEDRPSKPGERPGEHCRIAKTPDATAMGRHIVFDTNHWKTTVQRGLTTAHGDPGAITLFGRDPKLRDSGQDLHSLIADHLSAETGIETVDKRRGRTVIEWRLAPSKPDNHWLDCLVGCAVLASFMGVSSIPATAAAKPETPSADKPQQTRTRKARYFV